jgi:hypothetical protein
LFRSRFQLAAIVLFAALLATNFYRAATQSIVHDEALTWVEYLAGPASLIFQTYDANNHFLASILFKISVTLFGDSEFALRLPTLLAGAWFFWTLFRLSGLLFGDGWLFLLGCAALTLNPFLLDFLVAARGYGLAMAGLFWGLYQMLAWVDANWRGIGKVQRKRRLWKAAAGVCIAVAANLAFLMPAIVLAGAFCVLLLRKPGKTTEPDSPAPSAVRKKSKKARPKTPLEPAHAYASFLHFAVPIVLLAIAFLIAAPIDSAHTGDFYAGKHTAMASLQDLMQVSFGYGERGGPLHRIEQIWTNFALFFLPLFALTAMIVVLATKGLLRSLVGVATLFASLAVVGSAILLGAAHLVAGIPYPEDRTGIYFVPLASFAALGLARILVDRRGLLRWAGIAIAVVLASFAVEFAAQWNVKSFWVWRYDADSKQIFNKVDAMPRPANVGPEQIRLGTSWVYDPSLNFYRVVRNASWMAPIARDGFTGARDYYVVSSEDQNLTTLPRMKLIFRGPVSGTVLAIPQSP